MVSDYKFHSFHKLLKKEKRRPQRDLSLPGISIFHYCQLGVASQQRGGRAPSGAAGACCCLRYSGCHLWQGGTLLWGFCKSEILARFLPGVNLKIAWSLKAPDQAMREARWGKAGGKSVRVLAGSPEECWSLTRQTWHELREWPLQVSELDTIPVKQASVQYQLHFMFI